MKSSSQPTTAIVEVPATTANLGPGFDSLGVALDLFNSVTVARQGRTPGPEMGQQAARAFFEAAHVEPHPIAISITGNVPRSRGLGSSVTVRLGVLLGLNALHGKVLDQSEIFRICSTLEGHPDNAAPALFGGMCVAWPEGAVRLPVSSKLHFVLCIPSTETPTGEARSVLPGSVPHAGAVRNSANAARITAAFATKDYSLLKGAFEDHLHEPYRESLHPHLRPAVAAAVEAGALGGFLSGSGSTVAALTLVDPEIVARAMKHGAGQPVKTLVVAADNAGARVSVRNR